MIKQLIMIAALSVSASVSAELTGLDIAKQIDKKDKGWGDVSSELRMTLTNKQGKKSERTLSIKTLEMIDDGDKSLTVFNQPRDVKGTAFLSFSHSLEPDQQWLYLPALKRVKRISSSNKSGPFLGSEFAYEDISSFEVDKYTYELIGEDTIGTEDYYIVKFIPQYKHSGYKYQEVWVHKTEYRMDKTVYYDRRGAKFKTLTLSDWNKYLENYWRAGTFDMINHKTGKSTQIYWENYNFQTGLDEAYFNQNTLKRIK